MTTIEQTITERAKTHGNFHEGALVFDHLMCPIVKARHERQISPVQFYGLTMLQAKLTRILVGNPNETDHWQDAIGYLTLTRPTTEVSDEEIERGDVGDPPPFSQRNIEDKK